MSSAAAMQHLSESETLRILIIDDNKFEIDLTSTTLGLAFPDADVQGASDPFEALDLLRESRFDCVLIDYNMPKMDGVSLGGLIRNEHAYLPLLLMTGVGYDTLVADAMRGGFTDYIPKDRITQESAKRAIERSIQALAQARLIDEQRQELEHFAYALAHDFKQPIRQISVFSDLISEELGAAQGGDVVKHLGFLSAASRRLSALVDVMSQYTLLNKAPELGMIELGDVIANVRHNLEGFIAERNGVLLAVATARFHGNEALFTQVLQNLVMNGLRYNQSEKPRVSIACEAGADGKHRIIVSDNGIGIEQRFLEEIFSPLMRLHTMAEYPGSGLGLTIARKAVLAQGGRIWCRSTPGEGSAFIVELAAQPPSVSAP